MTENELRTLVENYAEECKLTNIFRYPWGNDKSHPMILLFRYFSDSQILTFLNQHNDCISWDGFFAQHKHSINYERYTMVDYALKDQKTSSLNHYMLKLGIKTIDDLDVSKPSHQYFDNFDFNNPSHQYLNKQFFALSRYLNAHDIVMLSERMKIKKICPSRLVAGFILRNPQYEPQIIQLLKLTDQEVIKVFKAWNIAFQEPSPLSYNDRKQRLISTFNTLSDASKSALQKDYYIFYATYWSGGLRDVYDKIFQNCARSIINAHKMKLCSDSSTSIRYVFQGLPEDMQTTFAKKILNGELSVRSTHIPDIFQELPNDLQAIFAKKILNGELHVDPENTDFLLQMLAYIPESERIIAVDDTTPNYNNNHQFIFSLHRDLINSILGKYTKYHNLTHLKSLLKLIPQEHQGKLWELIHNYWHFKISRHPSNQTLPQDQQRMYKEMSLPKDLLKLLNSGILDADDDDLTDELSQTIIDHRNAIVRYRPDLINTLLSSAIIDQFWVLDRPISFDPDTFDIVTRAFKEDGDEEDFLNQKEDGDEKDFLNQLVTLFNNEQPTDPTMVNGIEMKPSHYQEKARFKSVITNLRLKLIDKMSSLKGDDNACIKLIKCIQKPDNLRPSALNFYKIFFKEWLGSQTENTLSQPIKESLVDCLNHLSKVMPTIENTDFEQKQLFADIYLTLNNFLNPPEHQPRRPSQ